MVSLAKFRVRERQDVVVVPNPLGRRDGFRVASGEERKPCQVAVSKGQERIQRVGTLKLLNPFIGAAKLKEKIFRQASVCSVPRETSPSQRKALRSQATSGLRRAYRRVQLL